MHYDDISFLVILTNTKCHILLLLLLCNFEIVVGVGKLTLLIKLLQTVIYIVNCVRSKSGNSVE